MSAGVQGIQSPQVSLQLPLMPVRAGSVEHLLFCMQGQRYGVNGPSRWMDGLQPQAQQAASMPPERKAKQEREMQDVVRRKPWQGGKTTGHGECTEPLSSAGRQAGRLAVQSGTGSVCRHGVAIGMPASCAQVPDLIPKSVLLAHLAGAVSSHVCTACSCLKGVVPPCVAGAASFWPGF